MLWNVSVRKYLEFLHKHLVIVPVDKAANNVAFVCRRLYVDVLRRELAQSSGAYRTLKSSADVFVAKHERVLRPMHLNGEGRLPYLYWLPKLHENPPSQRFIAGSGKCTTKSLSELLSAYLNFVLRVLRVKDEQHLLRTGVRRFFVVTGYEEVAEFFSRWPRTTREAQQFLYTGDFSTMYTTIPHRDLLQSLRKVLREAWDWEVERRCGCESERVNASQLLLQRTSDGVEWAHSPRGSSSHSAKVHRVTLDDLMWLIQFLVGNIYVVNGDTCRRQVIGIPMGTNCAPALANLYLYAYESIFMDGLMAHDLRTARDCHMTFRLIDDVLSVDNPRIQQCTDDCAEDGGIYPRALRLNNTSISRSEVQFLGMRLRSAKNGVQLTVFDKRSEFPFTVRRYPHMRSLIPAYIPYGVFTGQLHRYYRICTLPEEFVAHSALLAHTLFTQGCALRRLRKAFHAFVSSRARMRWYISVPALCSGFQVKLGSFS